MEPLLCCSLDGRCSLMATSAAGDTVQELESWVE